MLPAPELPPVYEPVPLAPGEDCTQEAARRARAGAEEGTLLWCGRPGPGRARLGEEWLPPSKGLSLGLVLRPEDPLPRAAQIALVATVALGVAVAEASPAMTDLRYRWPNNLLLGEGRAAAVDLRAGPPADWLVLGLHANLAGEPEGVGAASLQGETGVDLAAETLLEAFARHFLAWVTRWDQEGMDPVRRAWQQRDGQAGDPVRLALPGGALEGRQAEMDADGALALDGPAGDRRVVTLADAFGLPR